MPINSKYPPMKPCGLTPGASYRVARHFKCAETSFTESEVLVFDRETYDTGHSCDAWIFRASGPEPEKAVLGLEEFAEPYVWTAFLTEVAAK